MVCQILTDGAAMCPQCCKLVSDLIWYHAINLVIGCFTDTLDSKNILTKNAVHSFFVFFFRINISGILATSTGLDQPFTKLKNNYKVCR